MQDFLPARRQIFGENDRSAELLPTIRGDTEYSE
jgi:hypothetical protein